MADGGGEGILEVIARRRSARRFDPAPVDRPLLDRVLRAAGEGPALGPAPIAARLVADGRALERGFRGILGDYGKILSAPHYAVLVAEEGPHWLLDAGWRFERLVLEATRLGLGTCWVGGFFLEERVRAALALAPAERVVALTPLGRPAAAGAGALVNRAFRGLVRASARKPVGELFFLGRAGEPLPPAWRDDPALARLWEATRRAPSWVNRQPWRFAVGPERVLVWKEIGHVKEGKDYHLVDCGIAMQHFALAAAALGFPGGWTPCADPVPGAAVTALARWEPAAGGRLGPAAGA